MHRIGFGLGELGKLGGLGDLGALGTLGALEKLGALGELEGLEKNVRTMGRAYILVVLIPGEINQQALP